MNTTVKCNECKKDFLIEAIKKKKLNGGAVLTYFSCPHCGKRYKVNIMNAYLKKLIAQGMTMDRKKNYEMKLERRHKEEIKKILNERDI